MSGHTDSLGNSVPTDPDGSQNSQQYITDIVEAKIE